MNKGYVRELLEARGNLYLFRDVAHRVGGFLSREYIERYSRSDNTVLLPVLRAGSAFEKSLLKRIFPAPRLHYIATKRNPETLKPEVLYKTFRENCCENAKANRIVILEPMLATGGTMMAVINEINKSFNSKQIVIISAFVSKKAEELLGRTVYIVALSKGHDVDEKGYILIPDTDNPKDVSTLDFGDQYCGTYSHRKEEKDDSILPVDDIQRL